MSKDEFFKKIYVKDKLPEKDGEYKTNLDTSVHFISGSFVRAFDYSALYTLPTWWLEPVAPIGEDVMEKLKSIVSNAFEKLVFDRQNEGQKKSTCLYITDAILSSGLIQAPKPTNT